MLYSTVLCCVVLHCTDYLYLPSPTKLISRHPLPSLCGRHGDQRHVRARVPPRAPEPGLLGPHRVPEGQNRNELQVPASKYCIAWLVRSLDLLGALNRTVVEFIAAPSSAISTLTYSYICSSCDSCLFNTLCTCRPRTHSNCSCCASSSLSGVTSSPIPSHSHPFSFPSLFFPPSLSHRMVDRMHTALPRSRGRVSAQAQPGLGDET